MADRDRPIGFPHRIDTSKADQLDNAWNAGREDGLNKDDRALFHLAKVLSLALPRLPEAFRDKLREEVQAQPIPPAEIATD